MAWPGPVRSGKAGTARRGSAGLGWARRGRRGKARFGTTGLGGVRHSRRGTACPRGATLGQAITRQARQGTARQVTTRHRRALLCFAGEASQGEALQRTARHRKKTPSALRSRGLSRPLARARAPEPPDATTP